MDRTILCFRTKKFIEENWMEIKYTFFLLLIAVLSFITGMVFGQINKV